MVFHFKDFLKQDYQDLVDNLNERTLFSLRLIQLNVWLLSYKECFRITISQTMLKVLQIFFNIWKIEFFFSQNPIKVDEDIKTNQIDMDSLISELFDEHKGKFRDFAKEELSFFSEALFDLFSIDPNQTTPETIKTIQTLLNQEKEIVNGVHLFLKTVLFQYFSKKNMIF